MNRNLHIFLLFLIILLGFILRIYRLDDIPHGFFADEASIGYNAYTILTQGKDEHGISFPVFFQAFGEYKNPIQTYTTIPFIALFGLNEFAVRLPSALFGTFTIIVIYFLVKKLCGKLMISFFATFFLAISPWHIHFSRTALEGQTAFIFFTTSALYSFLKVQKRPQFLYLTIILLVLAFYSYFPARLFIPLFSLCIFLPYFKFFFRHKRETLISLAITVLLLMPFMQHILSPVGNARWKQVSIFINPSKEQSMVKHITDNYFSHFSFDFLFLKGDIDMQGQLIKRHSVRGMGELYLFQFPLLFSFIYLIKTRQYQILYLIFIWLLLYPIGSMFTIDKNAQATRSIIGVIPFQILSAIGLWWEVNLLQCFKTLKGIMTAIITTIIAILFFNFLNLYFIKYSFYSSDFWGWQYGAQKNVRYFVSQQKNYDELVMAPEFNAPEIFFKFYAPHNCDKCKIGLPENLYNPNVKQLFAVTPIYLQNNPLFKFKILKNIYYPNNSIAFEIGEVVK